MSTLHRSMPFSARLAALAAAALCTCGPLAAQSQAHAAAHDTIVTPDEAAQQQERFQEAMQAYERNHWSLAFLLLSALADTGHADSARVALQMWHHGPALYRGEFHASARQIQRWTLLWGCAGDATGRECTREVLSRRTP
jgi:hypothetical protein